MKLEVEKLESLFEEYKFDFISINPKDIDSIDWEFIPEDVLVDSSGIGNYLGKVKLKNTLITVLWNVKITPGDVIFKYKNIKKERSVKLSNIIHNSSN